LLVDATSNCAEACGVVVPIPIFCAAIFLAIKIIAYKIILYLKAFFGACTTGCMYYVFGK
jgi:hypothetical protein